MDIKRRVNDALQRLTGYQLTRVGPASPSTRGGRSDDDRLVPDPVFIHCSVRSGSTLLKSVLGSHSTLHAPHELHLRHMHVELGSSYVQKAMKELGMSARDLEHLLWDRILDTELAKSGKTRIVVKTPNHVFMWRRIAQCWPGAAHVFLLRHPASIARSWHQARPKWTVEETVENVLGYMNALNEARTELPGITVRYEELTAEPERVGRGLCDFLGLAWEPGMLEYGKSGTSFKRGLGDWKEKISSGRIQQAAPFPDHTPEGLHEICRSWDYPITG
ncbi:sulfotransferase family protein [Rhizohabitans arisaemae]|uniref:sulfotransferase family protein n=1 Tax=Rhizohabitans arisaemae TaxID=2720610 RepID=UPI0024B0C010|nr:sulfotransferase [Rhizohabitans arisaemae]